MRPRTVSHGAAFPYTKGKSSLKILIIDGQGGGIGKALAEQIRTTFSQADLIALGTNSAATSNIMRGGAKTGATGENAIIVNCGHCTSADIIVGPIGIVMANAIMGEITPAMAQAVSNSAAHKVLLPTSRCHALIVGVQERPMAKFIEETVNAIKKMIDTQELV